MAQSGGQHEEWGCVVWMVAMWLLVLVLLLYHGIVELAQLLAIADVKIEHLLVLAER